MFMFVLHRHVFSSLAIVILLGLLCTARQACGEDLLSADASLASIIDLQGRGAVRPVGSGRWTPVAVGTRLLPGDLLRSPARGANAVQARLVAGGEIIVGPGAQLEFSDDGSLHLLGGEIELRPQPGGAGCRVTGPGDFDVSFSQTTILNAGADATEVLQTEPRWLSGYRASTTDEWMGSLLAKVDGRDVPLTVGYHSVRVDIRDQIARTVIEESFVNNTNSRLEGVFTFPLPADASISGFGMWIGNELVEADIVEKQRAREIFETILRERRDPGLLEWSGGNLFKARVFPIEAHSEKRIRISYTQVLPLAGDTYRYRYALASEMLRMNPLRELSIQVRIDSAAALTEVHCPSHEARVRTSDHAAQIDFEAQEYSPDRDLEIAVRLKSSEAGGVSIVPHQRGDDGYFMVLVTPPGASGDWQRVVVPDGDPLDLLIIADTSGSIDPPQRAAQLELLATLFDLLGPEDRVRILATDWRTEWIQENAVAADSDAGAAAIDKLAARRTLGWSDPAVALRSAAAAATATTTILYLGDGIPTAGAADAAALIADLRRELKTCPASFHAVGLGSAYEAAVLDGIATLGAGGSSRIVGDDPSKAAAELVAELTTSPLRNLALEFAGVRVARVYPERLPSVPAGKQLIVLGRYLPENQNDAGAPRQGEVILRATLEGKPVSWRAPFALPAGEQQGDVDGDSEASGNSFLPRLWARHHIEHLLAGGRAPEIKAEVIAYSEEFGIMTPYTSFLVLESDADRERFGVQRRVKMRDGERFFADGADRARAELAQKQMLVARLWRANLRASALRMLAGLGRDVLPLSEAQSGWVGASVAGPIGGGFGFAGGDRFEGKSRREMQFDMPADELAAATPEPDAALPLPGESAAETVAENEESDDAGALPAQPRPASEPAAASRDEMGFKESGERAAANEFRSGVDEFDFSFRGDRQAEGALERMRKLDESVEEADAMARYSAGARSQTFAGSFWWQDALTPILSPPMSTPALNESWPEDLRKLATAYSRRSESMTHAGGLAAETVTTGHDAFTGEIVSWQREQAIIGADLWFTRSSMEGASPYIQWCRNGRRGLLREVYATGVERDATAEDLRDWPTWLLGNGGALIFEHMNGWSARLMASDDKEATVEFSQKYDGRSEIVYRMRIDLRRRVVLESSYLVAGALQSRHTNEDFVEIGGRTYAKRSTRFGADDKVLELSLTTLRALTSEEAASEATIALAPAHADGALLLESARWPSELAAREAIAAGNAANELISRLVLSSFHGNRQQWEPAREHAERAIELVAGKTVAPWLRLYFENFAGRCEEARVQAYAIAIDAVKLEPPGDLFAATALLNASRRWQPDETLEFLQVLAPIYERGPLAATRKLSILQQRAELTAAAGRLEAAVEAYKELLRRYPENTSVAATLANSLVQLGRQQEAITVLRAAIALGVSRGPWYRDQLHRQLVQILWTSDDTAALIAAIRQWIADEPQYEYAYGILLSALLRAQDQAGAEAQIAKWLALATNDEPLSPATSMRLSAAIRAALGNYQDLAAGALEPRWIAPLAGTARTLLARSDSHCSLAYTVLNHPHFRATDAFTEIRSELIAMLGSGEPKKTIDQLENAFSVIDWSKEKVSPELARPVVQMLVQRFEALVAADAKDATGEANRIARLILAFHDRRLEFEDAIAFNRKMMTTAAPQSRYIHAASLAARLMAQPWSSASEDELWQLIDLRQAPLPEAADAMLAAQIHQLAARIQAVMALIDWIVPARVAAVAAADQERAGLERKAQHHAAREDLLVARRALVDRLSRMADDADRSMRPWLLMETLALRARLGDAPAALSVEVREIMGALAQPSSLTESSRADNGMIALPTLEHAFDPWLRRRDMEMLAYLATAPAANADREKLVAQLAGELEAFIAVVPDDPAWRGLLVQVLLAADDRDRLERTLAAWAKSAGIDTRWLVLLARVRAEVGAVDAAAELLLQVERDDKLSPNEYALLADLLLASGKLEEHRRVQLARYMATPEWQLSQQISQAFYQRYQRSGDAVPEELDPEILLQLTALFARATDPANHLHILQNFYSSLKDFRLLACMTEGFKGHTMRAVYQYLMSANGMLGNIHEEATCDELMRYLESELANPKVSAVDRRALLLAVCMVERRAVEVLNQDGPHVERARAALEAAFAAGGERQWQEGEPLLMANLLGGFGAMRQSVLRELQIAQMTELWRIEKSGTFERLCIAHALARVLAGYGEFGQAIARLESALAEYRAACRATMGSSANAALSDYVSYLETAGLAVTAEAEIESELALVKEEAQVQWLEYQLLALYQRAIVNGKRLAAGEGVDLYVAARQRAIAIFTSTSWSARSNVIELFCGIHESEGLRAKQDARNTSVARDLREFAMGKLLELLAQSTEGWQRQNIVGRMCSALANVDSKVQAIEFLVVAAESEPSTLLAAGQDFWSTQAHRLAGLCENTNMPEALSARVLAIIVSALRRDIATLGARNRTGYSENYSYFWEEREQNFVDVANEMLAASLDSEATCIHVASYFAEDLRRINEAIEILFAAHQREILNANGKVTLCQWLQRAERWEESLGLLRGLVEQEPDVMGHRVLLMRALHHVKESAALATAFANAEAHFRAPGLFNEGALVSLARVAAETSLLEEAARCFDEVILLHQERAPNRGVGDGTLSLYLGERAVVLVMLGKTALAVDSASAAIVSWGTDLNNRRAARASLDRVLGMASDLLEFAAAQDERAASSGLDSPILRQSLGRVLIERHQPAAAVTQLQAALLLQPEDRETLELLMTALELNGEARGVIDVLMAAVQIHRRDYTLICRLAERLEQAGDEHETRGAWTNVVELLPDESQSHAALARYLERHDDLIGATVQWQAVCRIRALEPAGFLEVARILIKRGEKAAAAKQLDHVLSKKWPEHFGDAHGDARALYQQIE